MVVQGLKRKLRDDVKDSGWENQLQSVLNISVDKYERDQALAEPSLLRSVLITNTLRQAKTHMEAVSRIENPAGKNRKRRPAKGFQQERGAPSRFEDMDDDYMEDLSLSSAITTILQNLDSLDGSSGSYAPQRSPLASVGNLTGDRTCRKSLNKSFSHHLQDRDLHDLLLDFDTSISKGQVSDHTFVISPRLGNEIGFLHSV